MKALIYLRSDDKRTLRVASARVLRGHGRRRDRLSRNYLRFMERARTEWLRKLGFEQGVLAETFNVLFVVKRTDVRYVRGAKLNDNLEVTTTLQRLRGASIVFEQIIEDRETNRICSAEVGVACVDPRSYKPRRIPLNMMRVFQGGG